MIASMHIISTNRIKAVHLSKNELIYKRTKVITVRLGIVIEVANLHLSLHHKLIRLAFSHRHRQLYIQIV